jgi:hypothetical protein
MTSNIAVAVGSSSLSTRQLQDLNVYPPIIAAQTITSTRGYVPGLMASVSTEPKPTREGVIVTPVEKVR